MKYLWAIDIICEECLKTQNESNDYISGEILLFKSTLIRKVKRKYKPWTNNKKVFRASFVSFLKSLEKTNNNVFDYSEKIIQKFFYPNLLTAFFIWCNENTAFLSVFTPFAILLLTAIFVNNK